MARPEKVRMVSELPRFTEFISVNSEGEKSKNGGMIRLSVEEYELVKLMDYDGKTQEECASSMGVSRGTIQVLYQEARKKIARHLVEGLTLEVKGGNYQIHEESFSGKNCSVSHCNIKKQIESRGKRIMKIAVTYDNGVVFQHFGHTETFKVYNVEEGVIISSEIINTNGQGHGALANFLFNGGVDVLICGGIGGGARNALAEVGIELYPGAHGDADEQVKSFIEGKLKYDPNTMCNHHSHEEGHSCGQHQCNH